MNSAAAPLAIVLFLAPAPTQAQSSGEHPLLPYTFVAPGQISCGGSTLHAGGGIEAFVLRALAASVELGYIGPFPAGFDQGVGILSTNVSHHFPRPTGRRLTPFVTGGYSLGFRSSLEDLLNVGAGFNYWINTGVAVRIELRDHFPVGRRSYTPHLWGVRAGVAWKLAR